MLQNTRPIDRLRFQAILVLSAFDADGDGKLTLEELQQYRSYCQERFGATANSLLSASYDKAAAAAEAAPGRCLDQESFIDLVREQVGVLSTNSKLYLKNTYTDADLARFSWKTALPPKELATALAVFQLLDRDGDKYLRLEELRRAQGIEREMVDDKLEDADTNEDGFLNFEDWLSSYAREKPVFLNIVVLLAHTAAYYCVLNLPVDLPIKAVACAALMLKPQMVTAPAIRLYQIVRTVWDRIRAEMEMMQQGGGGSARTA